MATKDNAPSRTNGPRADKLWVFVSVVGIAAAFVSIYKYAQHGQPGNAIWGGIAILAFGFQLATDLARMRKL